MGTFTHSLAGPRLFCCVVFGIFCFCGAPFFCCYCGAWTRSLTHRRARVCFAVGGAVLLFCCCCWARFHFAVAAGRACRGVFFSAAGRVCFFCCRCAVLFLVAGRPFVLLLLRGAFLSCFAVGAGLVFRLSLRGVFLVLLLRGDYIFLFFLLLRGGFIAVAAGAFFLCHCRALFFCCRCGVSIILQDAGPGLSLSLRAVFLRCRCAFVFLPLLRGFLFHTNISLQASLHGLKKRGGCHPHLPTLAKAPAHLQTPYSHDGFQ